jgi:hypothetical protein
MVQYWVADDFARIATLYTEFNLTQTYLATRAALEQYGPDRRHIQYVKHTIKPLMVLNLCSGCMPLTEGQMAGWTTVTPHGTDRHP